MLWKNDVRSFSNYSIGIRRSNHIGSEELRSQCGSIFFAMRLRLKAFGNFCPVDDVPPCADVIGAAVLVVEIVGVLPDIEAEDGFAEIGICTEAFHEWVVLVGRAGNFEFAILQDQPCPARAETFCGSFTEGFFEIIHRAKGRDDGGAEFIGRSAGFRGGGEGFPEKRMIPMTSTVVTDRGLDGYFGDAWDFCEQIGKGHRFQLRSFGERGV